MDKSIYYLLITLSYILITAVYLRRKIKTNYFKLDHRSLLEQRLFWFSILYPFITFVFFGSFVWIEKFNSFSLTAKGYEHFLEISKFPLLFLAASVPLASIVNNLHRTIQTEKQITEAERKNKNDLHYNHLKFHTEFYKKIETRKIECKFKESKEFTLNYEIYIQHPLELYRKCYPGSSEASFEINMHYIRAIKNQWNTINNACRQISTVTETEQDEHLYSRRIVLYYNLMSAYEELCHILCLGGYHSEYSIVINDKPQKYQLYSIFYDFRSMYKSLLSLQDLTNLFLDTCRDTKVNEIFPLGNRIFPYGSGIVDHWFYYLDFIAIGDYQAPQLTKIGDFLNNMYSEKDGGNLAAER